MLAQNTSFNIPDAPNPARFVMDYVGVLSDSARVGLESRLRLLNDSSAQMQVVLIEDLKGADPIMYGTELGRKWGVGDKDKNNGVVFVIQPKTAENNRGDVGISVGYGLEPVFTDAFCKRIIEKELIPNFKENDYAGGINAALDVMIPIVQGEESADSYLDIPDEKPSTAKSNADDTSAWTGLLYVFLIIGGGVGFGLAVAGILKLLEKVTGSGGGRTYRRRDDDDEPQHFSSSSSSRSSRHYGGGSFGGGGAKGSW